MRSIELKKHPSGTISFVVDDEPLLVGWNVAPQHLDVLKHYQGLDIEQALLEALKDELAIPHHNLTLEEQSEIMRLLGVHLAESKVK